ncbi:MAG TPA: response regulator [Bryobacteraceae bacterium]|nr:response regulator [Bryobacteraceae bacterium]
MTQSTKYRVLVVEDEGLIARDIAGRLEALGHEVVGIASTAEGALEQAPAAEVVLMDIQIDGPTDGVKAAAQIRDRYHVPVIFLTAHADRATLDRAKLADPFGYIVKPLGHASLHTSLEIGVYKHRMERQLEEREAWLRATLSSVAEAVIVTDVGGRLLMMNQAAETLTGWTLPEASGQPVSKVVQLVDPDSGAPADDPVPLAILRDAPLALDRNVQLLGRGGRQMMVEGSVAPAKAAGAAIGAVFSLRDVSAQRWEQRQLQLSQKMEAAGRLAAGVSNEFANLLATIRNQSEHLIRQFAEYSPARHALEEIQRAAGTADQIMRRLAGFGTRQMGHPQVLSLNAILRRMSKLIESVAGARIEIALQPNRMAGKVHAEAAQIEQMVMSLVMHACAAIPARGRLLIETGNVEIPIGGRMTGYVMLSITHSGLEADLDRMFEPAAGAGQSLGLSIAHNIVTEHGGLLSVQPTLDDGWRFEVLLPRSAALPLLPRPEGSPEHSNGAPTILLIEQRDPVRAQLHNFFEANGYNLIEASEASEAIALGEVHDGALDLLIVDAAEADRAATALRRAHPSLAVLRIVDRQEHADRQENVLGEISVPFTQAALLDRVSALLGSESASAKTA